METAYGDPDAEAKGEELERYLIWGTEQRRRMKRRIGD